MIKKICLIIFIIFLVIQNTKIIFFEKYKNVGNALLLSNAIAIGLALHCLLGD